MADMYPGNQDYIRRLEKNLAEAVARQDGLGYLLACEALGIEPEFKGLSQQGQVEMEYLERRMSFDVDLSSISDQVYIDFHKQAKFLDAEDETNSIIKGRLLEKYLPEMFGPFGTNPIRSESNKVKSNLFRVVAYHALERINKLNSSKP